MQKQILTIFNALKGDSIIRPQSELKVSTPIDKPFLAPMSAPPNVAEQAKMDGNTREEHKAMAQFNNKNSFKSNFSLETRETSHKSFQWR